MQIIYLSKKELSNTAFGTVQVKTWRAEVAGQVHRAFSGRPNWICLTSAAHRMIYTLQAGTVFSGSFILRDVYTILGVILTAFRRTSNREINETKEDRL